MTDSAAPPPGLRQRWQQLVEEEGLKAPAARVSPGGTVYEAVYFPEAAPSEAATSAALPGVFPFTRGPHATMYRSRPWTLRQYAGFSTPEETNAFFKACLAGGQRGLSVAFDLATHRGYDSDHERVPGDVGMAGVAVDSVEDLKLLFSGIPLAEVSVSMTMNGAVLPVLAAFIVAAEEQGVAAERLQGTIQNDILKEFMVRNTFVYPPEPSMRIVADVVGFTLAHMPKWNPISVSGYHFEEAGATPELELAYTLANGLAYVDWVQRRGFDVERFLPRLSFFFGIGMQFFLEVAKLRAARQLWAELVAARYAPSKSEALKLRMHCQTSGVSLTASEPLNNIARTTIEALAAVLGGTQSLHTNAYDEAWALPSEEAARVARATQLVLQHETDIAHTVDPLAGSYLVESLTQQLHDGAARHIAEIDQQGGMLSAIEQMIPQRRIAEAAAAQKARVDSGKDVIVSVNRFAEGDARAPEVRVIDNAKVREVQLQRLAQLRATRDAQAVEVALSQLEAGARGDANLLELSIVCMRARATLGEVSERLARVFGRYVPRTVTVGGIFASSYTGDVEWQTLRARVQAFEEQHGRRPRLLVAKLGQDGHDRGAKVIASGFADLGFDVDLGPLFQTPQEVARAALDHDVHVVGISTQAGAHLSLVPELIGLLRDGGGEHIKVVCGGIIPEQDHLGLKQAGVSLLFLPGVKVTEAAASVLTLLEAAEGAG